MNPGFLGALTALGWGSADFIARFSGRAMGHEVALFGMMSVSAAILSVIFWQADAVLVLELGGWWQLLFTGLGIMAATLLLYWGLARGPVSVVAPIVGSYPAFNIVVALLLGSRPSLTQWLAMAVVMLGVALVARASKSFEGDLAHAEGGLRKTVLIALASAILFALTIAAGQAAAETYGELQTVCVARWIGLAAILGLLLLHRRQAPAVPLRWWPVLAAQGLLDGGAYVALFASSAGPHPEIAVVVASGFSAVTVILARVILREAMTALHWAGIGLIVGGAATLSGLG